MKLISWNVNGIRACLNKGFADFFKKTKADIVCVQETKASQEQVTDLEWTKGYHQFWNSAEKKGYAGTAIFTKKAPINVSYGIGVPKHDQEGRVITLEYDRFFIITVYTPNAKRELLRLDYRQQWDNEFLCYLKELEKQKPLIFCGDLNVAHKEIDLANPKSNRRNPGFTDEERLGFDNFLKAGFVDTFRELNQKPGQYTWWTYRNQARARNIGWRIDYFCLSSPLKKYLQSSTILAEVMGSDHCPIALQISQEL